MRLEALHKKNLVKAKKIIVDSIMDQLVPQVSFLKTPKMFDSLTNLFEGKKHKSEYDFEKTVEEEVENAEVVIATLNGLPGSWDSFMRGMCAKRK